MNSRTEAKQTYEAKNNSNDKVKTTIIIMVIGVFLLITNYSNQQKSNCDKSSSCDHIRLKTLNIDKCVEKSQVILHDKPRRSWFKSITLCFVWDESSYFNLISNRVIEWLKYVGDDSVYSFENSQVFTIMRKNKFNSINVNITSNLPNCDMILLVDLEGPRISASMDRNPKINDFILKNKDKLILDRGHPLNYYGVNYKFKSIIGVDERLAPITHYIPYNVNCFDLSPKNKTIKLLIYGGRGEYRRFLDPFGIHNFSSLGEIMVLDNTKRIAKGDILNYYRMSEYCLVPGGDTPSTRKIFEVMMFDCHPISTDDYNGFPNYVLKVSRSNFLIDLFNIIKNNVKKVTNIRDVGRYLQCCDDDCYYDDLLTSIYNVS